MNALLLAAGFGTRLRPLTNHTPKCLVELGGRPLLDYWLEDLHRAGVDRFLVNTHYLPGQVERFLADHPQRESITQVHEPILLGTAGTLMANRAFLENGTALVAHADNLCLCAWRDFFEAHHSRPEGTIITMMTFHTSAPRECGIVETDERGVVRAFHEKQENPPGNLANAAVYLMEPEIFRFTDGLGEGVTDLSTQVLPRLMGKIHTWINRDVLIDIGTPERLDAARKLLISDETLSGLR